MKEWKKVDYLAGGVIYACGNERKIVIPGNPAIYYVLNGCEIRWYQPGRASHMKRPGIMGKKVKL